MPVFNNTYNRGTPFGINEYLRSTEEVLKESYTLAASTVPARTIDGAANQKVLQPGTVIAKITSGPETGKVGPYSTDTTGVTDGRSAQTNIVGILSTAIPWQLIYGDMEVAVAYDAVVKQGWCIEYTAANPTGDVLSNATATAMKNGGVAALANGLDITFKS